MWTKLLTVFNRFDWVLFFSALLLIAVGLAALYSIGLGQETQQFEPFKKQIIFAVVGIIVLFAATFFDYRALEKSYWWLYLIGIALLVLVLFFGVTIRGTRGWFAIGSWQLQPVELTKLIMAVTLSYYFAHRAREMMYFKNILFSGLVVFSFFLLIMLQPDAGSAFVIFGMWLISLFLTKYKKSHMAIIAVLLIVAATSSWFFVLADYQQDRIFTFINPAADPYGAGYNVTQSVIAVGAGQLVGRGLGFGSQSQLKFIPESQTDFIFAVVAEELGLVGVGLLLLLYAILLYRLIRIVQYAPDDFAQFLVAMIAIIFFIHIFVNVGMNMGLLPVTGISLPFVSAGGSFLIVSLLLIGIAQSVSMRGSIFKA